MAYTNIPPPGGVFCFAHALTKRPFIAIFFFALRSADDAGWMTALSANRKKRVRRGKSEHFSGNGDDDSREIRPGAMHQAPLSGNERVLDVPSPGKVQQKIHRLNLRVSADETARRPARTTVVG